MSKKFEYNYSAPTQKERQEIESIRNQYLPKSERESKVELLKRLDNKVKNIPMVTALTFGIVGSLIFGTGMAFFLEWTELWYVGIPFGLVGILITILAYPIYCYLLKKLKKKYSSEIIRLSNELIEE